MREDRDPLSPWSLAFVFGSLLIVLGYIWAAQKEAEAYNRITGSDVTAWDAMLLELRVNGEPKKP